MSEPRRPETVKRPLEVYHACVKALTDAGLIVILNCHLLDFGWCCANDDTNGLWFNDRWPIANLMSDSVSV